MTSSLLLPGWPAPATIYAYSSTRLGGVSVPPYDELNLGEYAGDNPQHVAENRQRFLQLVGVVKPVRWLKQVHGTRVIDLDSTAAEDCRGDAAYSRRPDTSCVVMSADCLPVLFCSRQGNEVAAAHAGWRGLCAGVLESTLSSFQADRKEILAWLGPAIGPMQFEVGAEVRQQFMQRHRDAALAFTPRDQQGDKYLADIYLLARQRLQAAGVEHIYGGDRCTYSEPHSFFSYRRTPITGRMASLIGFREK